MLRLPIAHSSLAEQVRYTWGGRDRVVAFDAQYIKVLHYTGHLKEETAELKQQVEAARHSRDQSTQRLEKRAPPNPPPRWYTLCSAVLTPRPVQ